ncbi:acyl-CoA reductase [Marinospirillum perlucidum]|uniref:acyl-CoA reductase n=1 Tax=Marinospirillum perlucidum TaxID=1982602 RepID=UPI00138FE402|nr:acyl-CoA reductase [Marinospirillum perlucidum]
MNWELLNPPSTAPQLQHCFHPDVLEYCQSLSTHILRDPESRNFPDLIGLGAWLRKGNIEKIQKRYSHCRLKPLGHVFHSAPANVDSLFVYSAVISLICGNINLIRLSNRAGGSSRVFIKHLQKIGKEYPEINARFQLVRCEHNNEKLNEWISKADGRVLWGSNEGIQAMRAKEFPAHGREITFAHKFSMAMINAETLIKTDQEEIKVLAKNFIKDNLSFSQQACSSAKLIFWIGQKSKIAKAKNVFWNEVNSNLKKGILENEEHYKALNFSQKITLSENEIKKNLKLYDSLITLDLSTLSSKQELDHPGCGVFFQIDANSLHELTFPFKSQHQTLSYWGFDSQEIKDWNKNVLQGIDRAVEIGKALDFTPVWDGVDLVKALSRELESNELH